MGNIALIPIGIAIILSMLTVFNSKENNKQLPKWILVISVVSFLVVIGKEVFVKDKVAYDVQFNEKKEASKQEAQEELEELEELQ